MRLGPSSLVALVLCALVAGTAAADPGPSGAEQRAGSSSRQGDGHRIAAAAVGTSHRVGTGRRAQQHAAERTHHPRHTSGEEPGSIPLPLPAYRGKGATYGKQQRQVAPGVTYTRWNEVDGRGPIRAHLLTVKYDHPGVALDYASKGPVRNRASVTDILAVDKAVAGVNGDFFDIGDTGAPLGIGRDRQRGLLHARKTGYNSAFSIDADGRPDIGFLALEGSVVGHPEIPVTNLNSPFVTPGGVGIYNARFGRTAGYRVTDGQRRHVRTVVIRDGEVHSTSTRLRPEKKIRGSVLVGRGPGAKALAKLKVGSPARVRYSLPEPQQMAITGNLFLVKDGVVNAKATDDKVMHPRTAVGIDRDTHEVLMLAVDGRKSYSRGLTMAELGTMMIGLGCDEALNLDGGGSTTMAAKKSSGRVGVVNNPSDGAQRLVSNALEVTYHKPR